MPKLSPLIVSVLSIFVLVGLVSATVLPRNIRCEITAPYCEDKTGHLITTLRRDVHGDYDADVEDLSDSAQDELAAPLCNDNSQCNLGQICNQGFCVAGCKSNVDCSRFHTCSKGSCTDSRGSRCAPNRSRCSLSAECCSGRCKRWGGFVGRRRCRGFRDV
ncbi:hypothetical protein BDQ94DRAFT_134889 [Aspergillus welwitschiae]|uniref:Uncharacterized protein n=1 Tax=Aspergillus welwitschiae TaxID=1341132 RepID=A0A3F3QIB4_9EURO|nr:hypothetical protein BDQ94DRAFT_134889 [Aspergillus welwitschiae]RDH38921.1 hypothetical protein BDQ94DRAFT_134889 [Aspergillus welwitschiae]